MSRGFVIGIVVFGILMIEYRLVMIQNLLERIAGK